LVSRYGGERITGGACFLRKGGRRKSGIELRGEAKKKLVKSETTAPLSDVLYERGPGKF